MTMLASRGFDDSTDTLTRLLASLRGITPPNLTPDIVDQITDAAEAILSPGPVGGYASWSAKARPDTADTAALQAHVPPMQEWLGLLVAEARTWDPVAAAEPIARATALGRLDTPADAGTLRGRLRQMAAAAIDLLEALVPVVDDRP